MPFLSRRVLRIFMRTIVLVLVALIPGPAPGSDDSTRRFQVWQVLDVATGQPVEFDEWVKALARQDVIYLGEEHHNRFHVDAAVKILQALLTLDRHPGLALEMFSWDGQAALDRYVQEDSLPRDRFLAESHWNENWGGSFDDYEPLMALARHRGISVVALNAPRPLVRKVATRGLEAALRDQEMERWPIKDETFVRDTAYRDRIVGQLTRCHGGLSDEGYDRMYEASLFRDEAMASTIASYLKKESAAKDDRGLPLVSYTGGGHIQYQLPIPNRVRRRMPDVKQASVYMVALDGDRSAEVEELVKERIADFVWLTPVGALGPAKRCR